MIARSAIKKLIPLAICVLMILVIQHHFHLKSLDDIPYERYDGILLKLVKRPYYKQVISEYKQQLDTSVMRKQGDQQEDKILLYTTYFQKKTWSMVKGTVTVDGLTKCPQINCKVTQDRKDILTSNAVIFHSDDMLDVNFLRTLSRLARPRHQRWIYYTLENPTNTLNTEGFGGLFNWTMSYQLDSDIIYSYGSYRKRTKPRKVSLSKKGEQLTSNVNYTKGKTRLVAWIVSHCGLLRDRFVHELKKYMPVYIAGNCAKKSTNTFHCEKKQEGYQQCQKELQKFKFYLAFENGFCRDYITEKYWSNALENNVVPVVMGAGPYHNKLRAIPGSFIDVTSFPSIKALAEYLLYLDNNQTAYNTYFEWKTKYELWNDMFLCKICEAIHMNKQVKVYHNMATFWANAHCDDNPALKKVKALIEKAG